MTNLQKKRETPSLRLQDPFLEEEKLKYENPLPSRAFILQILQQYTNPLPLEALGEMLSIENNEQTFFLRRIQAMEREGTVVLSNNGVGLAPIGGGLIQCQVVGHKDGYGFAFALNEKNESFFLSEREMKKVFHGDIVMIRPLFSDRKGKKEGAIAEVVLHSTKKLVGRYFHHANQPYVIPDDKRYSQKVSIALGQQLGAQDGQVVVVKLIRQPGENLPPLAKAVEVLGNYLDPGMEIEIALRKHDLPYIFPDKVVQQSKQVPKKVRKKDIKGRVDLRDMPLVTIDGETSRDFDDAVYAERQGKGFRLIVAIADVSFYVEPDDALDEEAYKRGTSVYFPRRVIPMLPEALSNEICSLNPGVDRLSMVCDMRVNAKGVVKKYSFYSAVIRSHARLTYTQVADWLNGGSGATLLPKLQTLHELFLVLQEARVARGAIEFDSIETRMIFNDQGKIDKIIPVVRNDAHRLIEECMLAANVCAADFLIKNKHKGLFRVHLGPTPEKLESLRSYLKLFGLQLTGGGSPVAMDYAHLAEQISSRPDAAVLQVMMLRSMQQAVYTPENQGHFGLSYPAYTHFTSPIRRYPDLTVHRAIKAILAGKKYKPGKWSVLGLHCSSTERRADDASRDVEAWLKTFFMSEKVGQGFSGKITAVTSFGLFVLLDDVFVEGLVHISDLGNDYFVFNKAKQEMVGGRSGVRYALGDGIRVVVAKANLDASQVELLLEKPINCTDERAENGLPVTNSSEVSPVKKRRSRRRNSESAT